MRRRHELYLAWGQAQILSCTPDYLSVRHPDPISG